MAVNKEELAKDLETPEYQQFVKETLAKKEFVIRSKDEETQFQTRFKTDVIEKEIPLKIKAVHDQYDKDTKELFGIDRNQDEKSYDYYKRAVSVKFADYENAKKELVTLKEQIAKGDTSGATAKQLQEAEEKARLALAEKDKEIADLRGKQTITEKRALLNSVYAEVKASFKKDLPTFFTKAEKAALDEALSIAVVKDGQLFKGDGKGGVAKDASFNDIPLKTYLLEEFKDVIDTTTPKSGSGSSGGGGNNTDPASITVDNFVMPGEVKTRSDLDGHLLELGIKKGTDQFNKIYRKFAANLPPGF
jgi:hypothetical protein